MGPAVGRWRGNFTSPVIMQVHLESAQAFVNSAKAKKKATVSSSADSKARSKPHLSATIPMPPSDRIVIYTDGSSLGNPGPGGYGVVIPSNGQDLELSGGFRQTTNNRMELLACIIGLEQVPSPSAVVLYSDSRYVVDGITKGWAQRWQRNNWRKSNGTKALNVDLWERLLALCGRHDVQLVWVKGHAGNPGNERCDQLATRAASQATLPPDPGYESAQS